MEAAKVSLNYRQLLDGTISRSIGEILHNIWVTEHRNTSGTIVTIVGSYGGEPIGCGVAQVLVLNA